MNSAVIYECFFGKHDYVLTTQEWCVVLLMFVAGLLLTGWYMGDLKLPWGRKK